MFTERKKNVTFLSSFDSLIFRMFRHFRYLFGFLLACLFAVDKHTLHKWKSTFEVEEILSVECMYEMALIQIVKFTTFIW